MTEIMERIKFKKLKEKLNNSNGYKSVCYRCLTFILYFWFKILGLLPCKIDSRILRENPIVGIDNLRFNFSYVGPCYNVLLFVLLVIFDTYIVHNMLSIYVTSRLSLEAITIDISFIRMLCASVIPLIYIRRQKLFISVLNRFEILGKKLNKCADYKVENDNTNYLIFTIYFVIMCCIIMIREMYFKSLISVLIASLPILINSGVIIQYAMLLNIIKIRFKSINLTLSKLGTTESKISLSRQSVLDDIDNIKRAYVELCEMCEDIGNFYGISILIVVTITSLKSIYNLYYMFLVLIDLREVDIIMILSGIHLIWDNFLFATLTTSVTKTIKQLAKFSSNLWHLTVEFTACDILPLDRTLLAIVNGTIATYLVIAVQFRVSSPS
ncbi:uncharacterized protein LOC130663141 isoform X2 [Microplitis mediator]|uniref:uncharacterized protein LOC130663141 isoform X2 n=1 Tax=Microplitis mediator TaxID=375433 RepID=UPI002553CFF6|nr:uncharacterized protein LOC130663141 isoform X2 [Microplitis mediator]